MPSQLVVAGGNPARRLPFVRHLPVSEVRSQCRSCRHPVERPRWHAPWLLARTDVPRTPTERATDQAERVRTALRGDRDALQIVAALGIALPRLGRVIAQTRRRVLGGEAVPAADRRLSLLEPHTQIVPRHKPGRPVAFGRKVRIDEVEGGIVTGYRVVERGGGPDYPYLPQALAGHVRLFGGPPELLAADRGMASAANDRLAHEFGVRRVARPRSGRLSDDRRRVECGPAFKRAYRFRAGIEGRIHVLRRDYGLRRYS